MDIRQEKTENAIKNAFLELRAKKKLEKITVKELCALARINKSTFYSHYSDIYALEDALEEETVARVLHGISQEKEYTRDNPEVLTRELCVAFLSNLSLINLLFSGKEQGTLGLRLEHSIKELVFTKYPEYRGDVQKNIILTYCIQGAYHAFLNNREADTELLLSAIESIAKQLQVLY